jgi:hypothetical protein
MMTMIARANQLRAWAQGMYPLEAATELLIRFTGGRFLGSGWSWMQGTEGQLWIDFAAITEDSLGSLSGGERRVLMIAASLGGGAAVDLSEAVTGIDRPTLELVLAAIAHANGSHEDSSLLIGERGTFTMLESTTAHPWPEA